jgi:hypothetical protein
MRPSRRLLLSRFAVAVSLYAVFSSATPAQISSLPIEQVESAQAAPPAPLPAKWNDAVRTLADRIASAAGPSRTLSIEWNSLSNMSRADIASVQNALTEELTRRHYQVGQRATVSETAAQIDLSLSESIMGYVWVAKIRTGSSMETAIVGVPRSANGTAGERKASLSLQRKIVWTQSERFVDFILPDVTPNDIPHMVILEPTQVSYYGFKQGRWEQEQTIRLRPKTYSSRDPRGMVSLWEGRLETHVPGESCTGSAASSLDLHCSSELPTPPEMEWPLDAGGEKRGNATFKKTRNYFAGQLAIYGDVEAKLSPFFTAAVMNTQNESHWILAELDGKARLYDDSASPQAIFSGWGDDIASVVTRCDGFWQVLVSGTGDWTQPDSVQVYEIIERRAVAVDSKIELPGPILALWPATDLRSARVVSRNLQTGMYEASIVSVSCSD